MRRREFIGLIGSAAAALLRPPHAAHAQQSKIPLIGYLGATTPSTAPERTAAFVQRLSELGWNDGSTVKITYRWAEGSEERAAQIAAEFVRLKVDAIVTSGVPAIRQAKRATSAIPIVFGVVADPVGTGLVASLAQPGGNVTGLSNQSAEIASKRLELLRELVPALRRLAIIANANNPDGVMELHEIESAARALGIEPIVSKIVRGDEIEPAFVTFKRGIDGLYLVADPLININHVRIQTLAMATRLPAIYNSREFVEAGGLMSYGPDFLDLWRRTAELVDKILRGAKPSDIPVEQPTKFDFAINLTTARALGLTPPAALLARADKLVD
jgi:putative ABC transport system substrate-binding protein